MSERAKILDSSLSRQAAEALLAVQVEYHTYSDFLGFEKLELYANRFSYPEYVLFLQRFYGASLSSFDPYIVYSFMSDGFTQFNWAYNQPLLNEGSDVNGQYVNFFPEVSISAIYESVFSNGLNNVVHKWNLINVDMEDGLDYSQVLYRGYSVYDDSVGNTNGLLELQFVTNDCPTTYSVYVEAF